MSNRHRYRHQGIEAPAGERNDEGALLHPPLSSGMTEIMAPRGTQRVTGAFVSHNASGGGLRAYAHTLRETCPSVRVRKKKSPLEKNYNNHLTGSPFRLEGCYTPRAQHERFGVNTDITALTRLLPLPPRASPPGATLGAALSHRSAKTAATAGAGGFAGNTRSSPFSRAARPCNISHATSRYTVRHLNGTLRP